MSREQITGKKGKYYYVISDELGTGNTAFRTSVNIDHPEALSRTNKKGVVVHEKEVQSMFGRIEDISFYEGDFGTNLLITLDPNEDGETPILSFGADSSDGEDVMRKLPNIDFTKEVKVSPYRFKPEDTQKERSGISIWQQDNDGNFKVKITTAFTEVSEVDGKKVYTSLHGFPQINWEEASVAERKIHWIKVNEFLVKHTNENIIPKLGTGTTRVSPIPKSYEAQELNKQFPKKESFTADIGEAFP